MVLLGFLLFAVVFAATGGKGLKRVATMDDHALAPGAAIPAGDAGRTQGPAVPSAAHPPESQR
jgi:hypothetical protein